MTQSRLADDCRGKFCSQACHYANATRPSGLTYHYAEPSPTWFRPGEAQPTGPASPGWRGDDVGYQALHRWVARNREKPPECEHCGRDGVELQWANKSHEYKREIGDWMALCRACHGRYDSGENRGWAVAKYGPANLRGYAR